MSEKQEQPLNQQPAMNQQLQPQQPIPQLAVQQQPAMIQLPQQQAQVWPTTQQPIVLQMTTRNQPIVIQNYNSARSRALGITQLMCGIAAVVFNIIGIIIHATAYGENFNSSRYYAYYYWDPSVAFYIGTGIWCSIFVILSGSFAVCAGKKKTKCWIVTHLVFAILGSIFAGIMFSHACWAVGDDAHRLENGFDVHGYGNYYNYDAYGNHYDNNYDYIPQNFYASKDASRAQGSLFISIMFLLVTACSLIACIWSSTLCCRVVCCASTPTAAASVRYMANPAGQQQMMILGANGQTFAAPQLMQNPGTTYVTQPTLPPAYIPQTGQMPAQMVPVQRSVVQQPYIVQQGGAPQPAVMTTSPPAYQ